MYDNGEKEICSSLYMVGACCHGCIHEVKHEEDHLCMCGVVWTDENAENVE